MPAVLDQFIRGAGTYAAHVNRDNPADTIQSIEQTLYAFDKAAEDERRRIEGLEKKLADYRAQTNRPLEHDARLKELVARQAELNAALDLDESDTQAAEPAEAAVQPPAELRQRNLFPQGRCVRSLYRAPVLS